MPTFIIGIEQAFKQSSEEKNAEVRGLGKKVALRLPSCFKHLVFWPACFEIAGFNFETGKTLYHLQLQTSKYPLSEAVGKSATYAPLHKHRNSECTRKREKVLWANDLLTRSFTRRTRATPCRQPKIPTPTGLHHQQ